MIKLKLEKGYYVNKATFRNKKESLKYLAEVFVGKQFTHQYYLNEICLTSLTRAKPKEKNEICCSISTRAVKCDGVFFVLQHDFQYGFQHA